MKQHISLLFTTILLTITTAWAQTPAQNAALSLKSTLKTLISQHSQLGYDDLWDAFKQVDMTPDGNIYEIYSNAYTYAPQNGGKTTSKEGDGYNREHSVPKSWFGSATPMYTDLFHMYPTDGWVNSLRGNNPYGEVSSATNQSANGYSKFGPCDSSLGYTGTVFEPADEIKGDIARTYFYMATCYGDQVSTWNHENSIFGVSDTFTSVKGYPGMAEWALRMFIKWSKNDPVSDRERERNDAIYKIQGNRNPFIDCPGLERFIWSDYIN